MAALLHFALREMSAIYVIMFTVYSINLKFLLDSFAADTTINLQTKDVTIGKFTEKSNPGVGDSIVEAVMNATTGHSQFTLERGAEAVETSHVKHFALQCSLLVLIPALALLANAVAVMLRGWVCDRCFILCLSSLFVELRR